MEIYYGTKEENNKRREDEFLNMSPDDRLINFIKRLSSLRSIPPSKNAVHPNHLKGNFVISKNKC